MLKKPLKKKGGRNKQGRITIRHRGGGKKRLYRVLDFGQNNMGKAKVLSVEYDPNRTSDIALIEFENGKKEYILAPQDLGKEVEFSDNAPMKIGNRLKLRNVPVGAMVYNVELMPGKGGRLARSAGSSVQVMAHENEYAHLKLPSGEIRKVKQGCFCSVGALSNPEHRFKKLGKAGRKRLKGRRPRVRGSAMNPVDHPHGGGEGKAGIGLKHPKTPWGKPAFGVKTRKKKYSDKLIIQRRKKK